MDHIEKLTVIQKSRSLNYYPIKHIDRATLSLIEEYLEPIVKPAHYQNTYPKLLNSFLGLTNQWLTYLKLFDYGVLSVFESFLFSIKSGLLIKLSRISITAYILTTERLLASLARSIPSLKNFKFSLTATPNVIFIPEMVEFYQGWYVCSKSSQVGFLRLVGFWNKFGTEKSRRLYKAAKAVMSRQAALPNHLGQINGFFDYLNTQQNYSCQDIQDPVLVESLLNGYCRDYFQNNLNNGNCLLTARKRWNDAVPLLNIILFKSNVFAEPIRGMPYVPPKRKIGIDTNVKIDEEGNHVKEKMLTDIPLHVTDEMAIKLLFDQIGRDINYVLAWASVCVKLHYDKFLKGACILDYTDLGQGSAYIRVKYKVRSKQGETTSAFAQSIGLPTSYTLDPFMYLLVNQHPEITERYLLKLELFDKHGRLVGLEKTDAGTLLVGYKPRRQAGLSQQKILLNQKSHQLIKQVIELTTPLRKFLQEEGKDDYRFLFLTCGQGFSVPTRITEPLSLSKKTYKQAHHRRIEQLNEYSGCPKEKIEGLAYNLSLTKFRASRGVQIYLKTRSVKAMSEALGHAKYKPELLSHYLPEVILQFFQSRWIRLFQRGIICEAMKDSSYFLEASKFETMNELESFIENHSIKRIPDSGSENIEESSIDNNDGVLISVNPEVLTALLSLEKAVKQADREVSAKALYWATFANTVANEIDRNSHDSSLRKCLEQARDNINVETVNGVLYG